MTTAEAVQVSAHQADAVYQTEKAKYVAAARAYRDIVASQPELSEDPGALAQEIVQLTGVEHSVAVIVALAPAS